MQNSLWVVYALIGAVFAAVVSVMSKRALDRAELTTALCVQSATMLLTLLAIATVRGRWPQLRGAPRGAMGLIAASGVAAAVSWVCGYKALQLSQVAKSTPLDKLSLPVGIVLAMIFLGERPGYANWVGVALMLAGAFLIARPGASG